MVINLDKLTLWFSFFFFILVLYWFNNISARAVYLTFHASDFYWGAGGGQQIKKINKTKPSTKPLFGHGYVKRRSYIHNIIKYSLI